MTPPLVPEPVSPSEVAGERRTLLEFLDFHRLVLLRKGEGLTPDQLRARLGPSTLTIGRLIRHMTFVEDFWFHETFAGHATLEPWSSAPWDEDPDWEMTTADGSTFEQLRADFEAACARSRAIVDVIDDLATAAQNTSRGRLVSLRWILVHMIEEYARHCGHADFLRESIDARVGD